MYRQPEIKFFIGYPAKVISANSQRRGVAAIPNIRFIHNKTSQIIEHPQSLSQNQLSGDKSVGSRKSEKSKKICLVSSSFKEESRKSSIKQSEISSHLGLKQSNQSERSITNEDILDSAFKKKSIHSQSERNSQNNSNIQALPNHIIVQPLFEGLTCNILNCEEPSEKLNTLAIQDFSEPLINETLKNSRQNSSASQKQMLESQCRQIPSHFQSPLSVEPSKSLNLNTFANKTVSIASTTIELSEREIPSHIMQRWKKTNFKEQTFFSNSIVKIAPFSLIGGRTTP